MSTLHRLRPFESLRCLAPALLLLALLLPAPAGGAAAAMLPSKAQAYAA
ncbi:MAG: hypothetical protein IRY94_19865, partial [Rhodospirillaceae bacterium]|nr:hypothetical protein [Rhodospirillaceae bacterium]